MTRISTNQAALYLKAHKGTQKKKKYENINEPAAVPCKLNPASQFVFAKVKASLLISLKFKSWNE